jgi:phospholipase C
MSNDGATVGVSMAVYPDALLPFTPTQFLVMGGKGRTYVWDSTQTDGQYAFSIYGPDRFVRSFAGAVVPAGQNSGQVPTVSAHTLPGHQKVLRVTLANEGAQSVTYTLTANDFAGQTKTVRVGRQPVQVDWPGDADGYYDLIVTANTGDGFTRRYAGRIA